MIRFRKIASQLEFAEVKETCRACGTEYSYHTYFSGMEYHSCMVCSKCQDRLWYFPEQDPVLDRYYGDSSRGRTPEERIALGESVQQKIESLVSPCSCGGTYHHVKVSEIDVPKICPSCGAPQGKKPPVFIDCREFNPPPPAISKRPVTLLDFCDDSLPDFSNSSPEELRDALKNPDSVHKRRAVLAISKLRGAFPYADDLLHLASETADSATQRLCIETLGKKGNASAVPYLIGLLGWEKPEPRASAEHSLLMITSQLIPEEFDGFLRLKHPEDKKHWTPEDWKQWWQEHKDTVKIRDYPQHIKERMGMA